MGELEEKPPHCASCSPHGPESLPGPAGTALRDRSSAGATCWAQGSAVVAELRRGCAHCGVLPMECPQSSPRPEAQGPHQEQRRGYSCQKTWHCSHSPSSPDARRAPGDFGGSLPPQQQQPWANCWSPRHSLTPADSPARRAELAQVGRWQDPPHRVGHALLAAGTPQALQHTTAQCHRWAAALPGSQAPVC